MGWPPLHASAFQSERYVEQRIHHRSDYDYDSLNRVKKVTEKLEGDVVQYAQAFTYDLWGNRTINQTETSRLADLNRQLLSVNTGNNQLGVPSGQSGSMGYDLAGNLTLDTYTLASGGERYYEAENRMIGAVVSTLANAAFRYVYEADGKRTRRVLAGQGEYWQVYGISGELLAEYKAQSAANTPEREYGYRNGQMLITARAVCGCTHLLIIPVRLFSV